MQAIRSRINNIKSRSPNLEFQYHDPEKNFDRRKVKGVVATLMKVKDPKFNVAIDTACGGKVTTLLLNVLIITVEAIAHCKKQIM